MAAEDVRPSAGRRAVIDLVSGSLGGVANVYVGQPLDTIKVKLQTFPHLYRGATQCGLNTFKTEGKTKVALYCCIAHFYRHNGTANVS